MPKKPAIEHDYDRKKDRFKITMKHFDLEKKWLRRELVDALTQTLDKKSVRKKRGNKVKDLIKNTRLEQVGD
jgi:lysyl-tRNA synthetase class II